MTSDQANRARRASAPVGPEPEAGQERGTVDGSAGDRSTPRADRRLLLAGLTVVLLAMGLIMIGMAARSLAEHRGADAQAPIGGPPSPTTSASLPIPAPPTATAPAADKPSSRSLGSATRPRADPVGITIPDIGVKTSVMHLGLAADKTVEVPPYDRADDVGWYSKSPTPGAKGPSVLIGHVDSPAGPAVFARMAQLDAGDKVSIKRSDGSIAVFSVDRVETFAKDKFPTRKVYGNTDHPTLRLITCGGSYDRGAGGYQANTVAFADLVSIKSTQH